MVIFLNLDGTCEKVSPTRVFQGSIGVTNIDVIAPFPSTTALQIGFILPSGLATLYDPMQYVEQKVDTTLGVWTYALKSAVTALTGNLLIAFNALTIDGNTTSYLCKVQVEESVLPVLPPEPDPSVYDLILLYLQRLEARTADVPNAVKQIDKVASNAFTYTTIGGVTSAPIVIGGGSDPPMYEMAASTISIPQSAWEPQYSGTDIINYIYVLTASVHGQMKDGATAADLWIGFDDSSAAAQGAIKEYEKSDTGDFTIRLNQAANLVVRVWNGRGIKGDKGEPGTDPQAREMIAAETERAEGAETALQDAIDIESARAKTEEQSLQSQIDSLITQELISIQFDATGWTLTNNLLGAYSKTLTIPEGKRILQLCEGTVDAQPRGAFIGATIYANAAFSGYIIIG